MSILGTSRFTAPTYMTCAFARQTAADATTSYYFAMSNPAGSGRDLVIRWIDLTASFDGTAAAATDIAFALVKGTGQNNPTTGTGLTPIKFNSLSAASVLTATNIQFKVTPLTITVTTGSTFGVLQLPIAVTNGVATKRYTFDSDLANQLRISQGDGLALANNLTSVIGQSFAITVCWSEILVN